MSKGRPPMFSRSSRHLFGKRTVAKHTKISDETAERLASLANAANKTESDFIATLIEMRVHGVAVVESMQKASLDFVSGKAHDLIRDVEPSPQVTTLHSHKRQA